MTSFSVIQLLELSEAFEAFEAFESTLLVEDALSLQDAANILTEIKIKDNTADLNDFILLFVCVCKKTENLLYFGRRMYAMITLKSQSTLVLTLNYLTVNDITNS